MNFTNRQITYGGMFGDDPYFCDIKFFGYQYPDNSYNELGFRVARRIK